VKDEELESAIDRVGRAQVFSMAKAYGWSSQDSPPKYVWWEIVRQIEYDEKTKDGFAPYHIDFGSETI